MKYLIAILFFLSVHNYSRAAKMDLSHAGNQEFDRKLLEKEFKGTNVVANYMTCKELHSSNFVPPDKINRVTIGSFDGHVYADFYQCLVDSRISSENLSKILTIQSETEVNYLVKLGAILDEKLVTRIQYEKLRFKNCAKEVGAHIPKLYFYTIKDFIEKEYIEAICYKYKSIIEGITSGRVSYYSNSNE